jgi:hypothetical protein
MSNFGLGFKQNNANNATKAYTHLNYKLWVVFNIIHTSLEAVLILCMLHSVLIVYMLHYILGQNNYFSMSMGSLWVLNGASSCTKRKICTMGYIGCCLQYHCMCLLWLKELKIYKPTTTYRTHHSTIWKSRTIRFFG